MQEVREQEFVNTGRWQEVNRMLEKVTFGDEELTEYLSMMARGIYLTGFKADYNEISCDSNFASDIFTIQLTNPNLNYEYEDVKNMQNMLLNLVGLHKFVFEYVQSDENYTNFKNELDKLRSPNIYKEDLDIVFVDDNFTSSEVDRFCVFEHEGKKYCVNYIKSILARSNGLLTDMPEKGKKKLNEFIDQVKNIYYNLKFDAYDFEASEIINNSFKFLEDNQYYRNLDDNFWDKLNLGDVSFQNEDLNKVLSNIKQKILPHLHITVNGENRFQNPHDENIPMFKNVDEIRNYMNEIHNVLKVLNGLNGLNGLSSEINENDLSNYQNLKVELKKYYYFFVDQYVSYVSFNEMPTKVNIRALKELLSASDYFQELSKSEQNRLFDLMDTIDLPNLEKIFGLINSPEDKQKTYCEIIQMILVSDISIEVMYYKGGKFGYKSLKGVIYQTPSQKLDSSSPGSQKININERLSNYLEDTTGQEYLKRMIFLPDNIDISTAVGEKVNSMREEQKKAIAHVLGIIINSDWYKSLEVSEKSNKINEIINTEGIAEASIAIDTLRKINKNGEMSDVLNVLTNPDNYKSPESREGLVKIAKTINNGLLDALYSQYEKDKKDLETAKESLNKIKWWHLIFPSNRRRKRELLIQVDELTKKQENFVELLSQTFDSLIAYKSNYPECIIWINEILKSQFFSENVYMLADIINNSLTNVLSAKNLKNLMESIKQISILREASNESEQEPGQPEITVRIKLDDENKLKLIKFVCEIAQNDLTGLLTQNVNEFLKLKLDGATKNDYKFRVVQNIYKLSKMCPNGVYPLSIHNTLAKNNNSFSLSEFNKLHNEIENELKNEESPLQILAKINSEEKQNQENQKISAR